MELADKVAIVTGARGDIGAATARRFLDEGAKLVPSAEGDGVGAVQATVERALAVHGRIDILVNADGLDEGCGWGETDRAEWERQLQAGPGQVFEWCRAVSPHMAARKSGRIVNVAAVAGRYRSGYFRTGSSFQSGVAYASGQGGVLALTRELAFELSADGIRVNAVVLGLIGTASARREWQRLSEIERAYILAECALGRLGTPDEAAATICFLASERSSYVTGTGIDVNGGWWMS